MQKKYHWLWLGVVIAAAALAVAACGGDDEEETPEDEKASTALTEPDKFKIRFEDQVTEFPIKLMFKTEPVASILNQAVEAAKKQGQAADKLTFTVGIPVPSITQIMEKVKPLLEDKLSSIPGLDQLGLTEEQIKKIVDKANEKYAGSEVKSLKYTITANSLPTRLESFEVSFVEGGLDIPPSAESLKKILPPESETHANADAAGKLPPIPAVEPKQIIAAPGTDLVPADQIPTWQAELDQIAAISDTGAVTVYVKLTIDPKQGLPNGDVELAVIKTEDVLIQPFKGEGLKGIDEETADKILGVTGIE